MTSRDVGAGSPHIQDVACLYSLYKLPTFNQVTPGGTQPHQVLSPYGPWVL